jgi:GT2 family glycosyltransferase
MKISVVLLEYNSIAEIKTAVETIRKFDKECEIVVSSNSLYDINGQRIAQKTVPDVKWTFNKENGGFGYGMTMGANIAIGEYIVFLNSDVLLQSDFNSMISYMEKHKNVGMIAPELVDENGVVQDSYRKTITPWNFFWRHLERLMHVKHEQKKTEPIVVDWVIGAFMLTKKTYFDMVGGFDYKTYFMYVEDMDLCHELKLRGLDTVYYPLVSAQYVGTRAARNNKKYTKIFLHSLFGYWKKNLFRK